MEGIPRRRKAIVMFSEGIDYPILRQFRIAGGDDYLEGDANAVAAAARGNVNFVAVDPRGLVGMTGEAIEAQRVK